MSGSRDPDVALARNELRQKPASHRHRNSWRVILGDKHARIQRGVCLDLWTRRRSSPRVDERQKKPPTWPDAGPCETTDFVGTPQKFEFSRNVSSIFALSIEGGCRPGISDGRETMMSGAE